MKVMGKTKERVTRDEVEEVRIVRKAAYVTKEELGLFFRMKPGSLGCSAPLLTFPSYLANSTGRAPF